MTHNSFSSDDSLDVGRMLSSTCILSARLQELKAAEAAASAAAATKDAELADAAEVAEVLTDELERLQAAEQAASAQHQQQARLPLTVIWLTRSNNNKKQGLHGHFS